MGLRQPRFSKAELPTRAVGGPGLAQRAPSSLPVSNILKAATGEGESGGSGKPHKNFSSSNHVAQNNAGATPGLLRRKEVTEEEAER